MFTLHAVSPKLTFSRHESFPFRFGWLKKGYEAVIKSPDIFNRDDAPTQLGVGKNMVSSIRYWCWATGIIEDISRGNVCVTDFGRKLLSDDGWDPYLEDIGTLWLLHWRLVSKIERATSWYFLFTIFGGVTFNKLSVIESLNKYIRTLGGTEISSGSLERDFACIRRMYMRSNADIRLTFEDTLDCPLADLDLLQEAESNSVFSWIMGQKPSLPDEIFAFAILEFIQSRESLSKTVPLRDVLFSPGSPGMAFKLTENAAIERIESIAALLPDAISFSETAGVRQIYFGNPVDINELLTNYYK